MRQCKHELWENSERTLILCPYNICHWYLKFYDDTHWISGIDLYWLIENGFKFKKVI